ncbi:hypothetical protein FB451DRAFT_1363848 [Mycena latifolia]|nr:hypothetical protein FB451DRAFT_1363848 [Mycena latifolia]
MGYPIGTRKDEEKKRARGCTGVLRLASSSARRPAGSGTWGGFSALAMQVLSIWRRSSVGRVHRAASVLSAPITPPSSATVVQLTGQHAACSTRAANALMAPRRASGRGGDAGGECLEEVAGSIPEVSGEQPFKRIGRASTAASGRVTTSTSRALRNPNAANVASTRTWSVACSSSMAPAHKRSAQTAAPVHCAQQPCSPSASRAAERRSVKWGVLRIWEEANEGKGGERKGVMEVEGRRRQRRGYAVKEGQLGGYEEDVDAKNPGSGRGRVGMDERKTALAKKKKLASPHPPRAVPPRTAATPLLLFPLPLPHAPHFPREEARRPNQDIAHLLRRIQHTRAARPRTRGAGPGRRLMGFGIASRRFISGSARRELRCPSRMVGCRPLGEGSGVEGGGGRGEAQGRPRTR